MSNIEQKAGQATGIKSEDQSAAEKPMSEKKAGVLKKLFTRSRTEEQIMAEALGTDKSAAMKDEFLANGMAYLIKQKRSENKTKWAKRIAIVGVVGLGIAMNSGYNVFEKSYAVGEKKVAVVQINGVIGERSASPEAVIPLIKKAFRDKGSEAVIISLNSPGGHPHAAERINAAIEREAAEQKKRVVAVIDGMGASAAYMVAMHTDSIIAGRYSLVGSIGTIVNGWDFHKALERVGVKQRSYASGKFKNILNPYSEITEEASTKTQEMVDQMAKTFTSDVTKYRGVKLKGEVDYFTGEVWTGEKAFEIGLVDEVATIEEWVARNFDEKTPVVIVAEEEKSSIDGLAIAAANLMNVMADMGRLIVR